MNLKYLIVAPKIVQRAGQYYEFPLGLAYISSALKNKGFDVSCLNLNHYDSAVKKLVTDTIKSKSIDVVLTGGLSVHYSQIEQVINDVRSNKPEVVTVLGGGILSSNPEPIFRALKPDYGILFEGEETVVSLAQHLEHGEDVADVAGLVYWNRNQPFFTKQQKFIANLDSIAWPDYEGFEADKYLNWQMANDSHFLYSFDQPRMLPMISSRSCPFSCTFCYHPLGNKYRVRSLDDFFSELKHLQNRFKINIVAVYDELFAMDTKRLVDFCNRIRGTRLKWIAQIRVDARIDDGIMQLLKDSGCFVLGFGLESASNRILASMNKHTNVAQMESILAVTKQHKIGIQGNFIFGDVEETQETANETLAWWKQHQDYQIALTPIYPYSGTKLYQIAFERGLIKDAIAFQKTKYPIVNVSKLADTEYQALLKSLVTLNLENRRRFKARILSMKKVGGSRKGTIYDISVECPSCGAVNHFTRFNYDPARELDSDGCQTACRTCNQRFTVFVPTLLSRVMSVLPFSLSTFNKASAVKRKFYQKMENLFGSSYTENEI